MPPISSEEQASSRPYDTTLRRERAAETRERIVVAGSELIHSGSIRDWKRLNIRAVAKQAGVGERTVYRHFGNERALSDAVMHRLEEEAGIDLLGMALSDIPTAARQILDHVASYPLEPGPHLDATLLDANQRQKAALLAAVATVATEWPENRRVVAAALFDVLWSVEAYERLVRDWQLDHDAAVDGIAWIIEMLGTAIQEDNKTP
jgi:AcrR family transcriptional regulator